MPDKANQDQLENWLFLTGRLFRGDTHKLIAERFASYTPEQLTRLLRHHYPDGVNDPAEIAFRRSMDEWLGEVSLLYLAWLSGYCSDPQNTGQGATILAILDNAALKHYYETYYPIALPWLFRLHLSETISFKAEAAPGAFEYFANLYERFRNDPDLDVFLSFLDGFSYGGSMTRIDIDTVIQSFENPDRIVEAFSRTGSQTTKLDRGIIGFLRFATFSTSLYDLLERCKDFPILQSAFWFFYAFWYREYEKDAKFLSIQAMKNATARVNSADPELTAIAAKSQEDIERVMRALTDGHYATALISKVPAETLGALSFEAVGQSTPPKRTWANHFAAYKTPRPDN